MQQFYTLLHQLEQRAFMPKLDTVLSELKAHNTCIKTEKTSDYNSSDSDFDF